VRAGDWGDLDLRRVVSAADGGFRCEGLAAGELTLAATSEAHGKDAAKLVAAPGQTLRWDPVLARARAARARARREAKPVANAIVEARLERGTKDRRWNGHQSTGADGRFAMPGCIEGEPVRITVRRLSAFPEAVLEHVVPGGEEALVRLPKEAWNPDPGDHRPTPTASRSRTRTSRHSLKEAPTRPR
jgi:hypothetical protein